MSTASPLSAQSKTDAMLLACTCSHDNSGPRCTHCTRRYLQACQISSSPPKSAHADGAGYLRQKLAHRAVREQQKRVQPAWQQIRTGVKDILQQIKPTVSDWITGDVHVKMATMDARREVFARMFVLACSLEQAAEQTVTLVRDTPLEVVWAQRILPALHTIKEAIQRTATHAVLSLDEAARQVQEAAKQIQTIQF